jgi:hypothetical protein
MVYGMGVAQNAKYRLLTDAPEPVVYLPLYQTYRATQETTIHLRSAIPWKELCMS